MAGYAFLSYARANLTYASQLERYLEQQGIVTWYDQEIPHRGRWMVALKEKIHNCGALLVVMTPEADESVWVERELNEAEATNRPVFPLLLSGDRPLMRLNELQYEDVRPGTLPSDAFIEELRSTLDDIPTGGEGEAGVGGDDVRVALDSDSDEAFRILKHIYGRGNTGPTTFRVREFLRRVEGLGTTMAIGRNKRTHDGKSDYVMVRAAGKRMFGAVAYVWPYSGLLTVRLRPEDVADLASDKIVKRVVRPSDAYGINCPLVDEAATDVAVELTKRALEKIRTQ